MSDAVAALRDGARRVIRAPAVLCTLWVLFVGCALHATYAVDGASVARALRWMLASVAEPTDGTAAAVIGRSPAPVAATATLANVLWLFLAGGILDRFARDHAVRAFGFAGAGGTFFAPFLRLAVLQTIAYALALTFVPSPAGAAVAIGLCSVVADYARVRAVVEDRRSILGAVAAAVGFIRRNTMAVAIVFAVDYAVFWVADRLFDRMAADWAWGMAPLAAVWLAVQLWVKLWLLASETALFQSRLAHAGYVARPEPVWPESPAAEAI